MGMKSTQDLIAGYEDRIADLERQLAAAEAKVEKSEAARGAYCWAAFEKGRNTKGDLSIPNPYEQGTPHPDTALNRIDIDSMRRMAKDSQDPVSAAIWGVGAELLAAIANEEQ